MKIDYVITYVNENDTEWYKEMQKYAKLNNKKVSFNSVRYRDWEMLKYIFRGIEKYMSWINNVYLIVASKSQIPEWINQNNVKIILHEQIIPSKFLPTFNSNTIELFMYNIPELSEYFIYGNDDIFLINSSSPDSWFSQTGLPKINIREKNLVPRTIYQKTLKVTENICRKELNLPINGNRCLRSDHSINPMLKSTWEYMWNNHRLEIEQSITPFRNEKNITQELSNYYHYLSHKFVTHSRVNKYFDFKKYHIIDLKAFLNSKTIQQLCVNDFGVKDFKTAKQNILKYFNQKFPRKSKYEL